MMASTCVIPKAISGERHLAARQSGLRRRAFALAGVLARDPAVLSVWLTGSVAKGHVDKASDLDLHVFTEGAIEPLNAWRFAPGDAAENLHVFPAASIRQGAEFLHHPPELGRWMASAGLADALTGAQQLYLAPAAKPLSSAIEALVAARGRPAVQAQVAAAFANNGQRFLDQARRALAERAAPDAHQHLRTASQELLVAQLISRGWILRGSKKRPEIARAYGVDAEAPDFFRLFERINGLEGLTPSGAAKICEGRQRLRAALGQALRRQLVALALDDHEVASRVAPYEAHNADANDYYQPLLAAGIYCGPVNHIRSFSGFPRLPALLMQTLGKDSTHPITEWSKSTDEVLVRDLWFEVSALTLRGEAVKQLAVELGDAARDFHPEGQSATR